MAMRYELPESQRTCACGSELHEMGVKTCLELERIERVKYACRSCEEVVRTAPGPDRSFEKGLLGRGFLVHRILEWFGYRMPYHRLEKKYAGEGLEVPSSKQGRVWICLDREGKHAYDFTESRKQEDPLSWLKSLRGYMHEDAYPGYDAAFVPDGATEVACWAHARRKFVDAERNEPELSAEILSRIRELYTIERAPKDADLAGDDRRDLRQEKATPILEELRAKLALLETQALPKSPLGKTIGYAQRPWALGRSNWLFAGSLRSGQRGANIMSLIQSAKINHINPQAYLKDVMDKLPTIK